MHFLLNGTELITLFVFYCLAKLRARYFEIVIVVSVFHLPFFLPNLDSSEERGVAAANIQGHICWSGNERFVTRFLLSEAGVKRVHRIKLMRRLGSGI